MGQNYAAAAVVEKAQGLPITNLVLDGVIEAWKELENSDASARSIDLIMQTVGPLLEELRDYRLNVAPLLEELQDYRQRSSASLELVPDTGADVLEFPAS